MWRDLFSHLPYQKTLIFFFIFLFSFLPLSSAIVQLKGKSFSFSFIDAPATFAVAVNSSGICGALYVSDPLDACSSLQNAPIPGDPDRVRFALIERGNCTFEVKVRNAQEAGFRAAVVYDDQENSNLISMIGDSEGILVHAVFISKAAGEILRKLARGEEGECCINYLSDETAWTVLVISLISLIIIMSILAIFFFARNRRARQQATSPHHFPPTINSQIVDVLPCFTFNTSCSDCKPTAETCSICLEDYKNGETLKVLPCQHEFHSVCVDAWLKKWGTFCPLCKRDIMADAITDPVCERTPLLSC
ncbi:receptor homology region transmembrane domain ring H2 motif protein 1 [Tasmannia lanceolata]|uniref:receptor homology region transmembrane domain ring H2 motif protein 1 n=1 Tax=Tasmannia lanceolata TaxID=3420 RepID=UPI004063E474